MIKKPMPTACEMRRNSRLSAAHACQQKSMNELSLSRERKRGRKAGRGDMKRTLAAPGDELAAVLDELARHLEEFLGLVHCCCVCVCVWFVGRVGGLVVGCVV
jgi:hypothetical protein